MSHPFSHLPSLPEQRAPSRTESKTDIGCIPDEIMLEIFKSLELSDFRNVDTTSKRFRRYTAHFMVEWLKDILDGSETFTPPFIRTLKTRAVEHAPFEEALRLALRSLRTMYVSIEYSSKQKAEDLMTLLEEFLALCFPSAIHFHGPDVVVTMYPLHNGKMLSPLDQEFALLRAEALAANLTKAHASSALSVKFNVHIPEDMPMDSLTILKHVEGVQTKMAKCLAIAKSHKCTARFLTLNMHISECKSSNFKDIAAAFPHVHDLRLVIDGDGISKAPDSLGAALSHFEKMTSLNLKVALDGDLDLTQLSKLHTLRIWTSASPKALLFPPKIERFAISGVDRLVKFSLSSGLKTHLHTLDRLERIELAFLRLECSEGLFDFLPACLKALDVSRSHFSLDVGQSHHHLTTFMTSVGLTPTIMGRLRKFSCFTTGLSGFKEDHLRVLRIFGGEIANDVNLRTRFPSLVELWTPISYLGKKFHEEESPDLNLSERLPAGLQILVLHDSNSGSRAYRSWDFTPLKHLRSLGLCWSLMIITPAKLPARLRTLGVDNDRFGKVYELLKSQRPMTRVVRFTVGDWQRGPLEGHFLTSYSKSSFDIFDDLQTRQRSRDARTPRHEAHHDGPAAQADAGSQG